MGSTYITCGKVEKRSCVDFGSSFWVRDRREPEVGPLLLDSGLDIDLALVLCNLCQLSARSDV